MKSDFEAVPGLAERIRIEGSRVDGRVRCLRQQRTCFGVWKVPVRYDKEVWVASGQAQQHAPGIDGVGTMLYTDASIEFGDPPNPDGVAFFFICNRHEVNQWMRYEIDSVPSKPSKPTEAEILKLIDHAFIEDDSGQPLTL